MVKVGSFKEKVYRLIKLKNQCIELGYDVELEDTDFLPENIDKTIEQLRKILEEEGEHETEGETTETAED